MPFETDVFVNCPFDHDYAPLLEAMLFCLVHSGMNPRLATERLENGENRLEKIYGLACGAKYSVHDLSRCQAAAAGDYARMNMPFELGMDLGIRRAAEHLPSEKKFLIFERHPYETKQVLSDLAGQDVEAHHDNFETVIDKVRNFLRVEAGCNVPGAARITADYVTFQGWFLEKKLSEGHAEKAALRLPTSERLAEMRDWVAMGKPDSFGRR
ncbi:hypothetical protein SAMN04488103_102632 [Gemmobacter aquatilis]|uniref:Uncharacterized protein n=1 Tax=Gemmobacter aquatilis TaxID=933059 RepID=A0A1H8CXA0_9RHOB|nr:hypothetical protein [Gemmobacter aquatilis]SEM98807.1 hypothetical protein SAMN04488103_102632 [Gemmobacter aquatilis]